MNQEPSLTSRQRNRLMDLLASSPTEFDYYPDLQAERFRQACTFRTAILLRNGRHEVWFHDTVGGLFFEGTFSSRSDAIEAESMVIRHVQVAISYFLDSERDEEWRCRPACQVDWAYPMTFTDVSDYIDGTTLLNEEELFAFLKRWRKCIFEPLEPGSLYWWSLVDANGVECVPVRNHRGVIRLEEPEVQPVHY